MSMQKHGMIGPDTPDLNPDPPGQKKAAESPKKKTTDELDRQDPQKRDAETVRDRLKGDAK